MKPSRLFTFAFLVLLTGCTNRLTDFTVISSKNIDVVTLGRTKRLETRVEGKDLGHVILGFPVHYANIKNAMDCGLQTVPGAIAMVDGVVYQQDLIIIPFLYGQTNYIVEGNPLVECASASPATQARKR